MAKISQINNGDTGLIARTKINNSLSATVLNNEIVVGDSEGIGQSVPMSGEATIVNTGAVTLDNDSVISKILTSYGRSTGIIADTDTLISAIQKSDGNFYTPSPNVHNIVNTDELNDLATGGVITVNSLMIIHINVTSIASNIKFDIQTGGDLVLFGNELSNYIYTGTETIFKVRNGSLRLRGLFLAANTPGTQLFDVIGNNPLTQFLIPANIQFYGWNPGYIANITVLMRTVGFVDWTDTLNIRDVLGIAVFQIISNKTTLISTNKPLVSISTTKSDTDLNFIGSGGILNSGESMFRIEPETNDSARLLVTNTTIQGELFDISGIEGIFTSVVDKTISSTTINAIESPVNTGIVRFTYTGDPVFIYQEVIISGFVISSSYNGTYIITDVGSGYFEISTLEYDQNDTGFFESNSIQLNEIGTSLSDGDGITVNTYLSTDYDGGTLVYNAGVNSFQINKAWTSSHTGTWSTKGLEHSDPRVIADINPGFERSTYNGFAHIQNNPIFTTFALQNIYQDINVAGSTGLITTFANNLSGATTVTSTAHGLSEGQNIEISGTTNYNGTYSIFNVTENTFDISITFSVNDATGNWYSRLIEGISNEGFKIINLVNSEMEYIRNEPFSGEIDINFGAVKTAVNQIYQFTAYKNNSIIEGGPFKKRTVTTEISSFSIKIPITLIKGDKLKPQVMSINHTNNIRIDNLTIKIN